jgi:hypothetical protein
MPERQGTVVTNTTPLIALAAALQRMRTQGIWLSDRVVQFALMH